MMRSSVLALALCLPVLAQPPAGRGGSGGRGGRGPAIQLTADQKAQYQAKVDELNGIVKSLRASKTNINLIADVDIFAKAGAWLVKKPTKTKTQAVTNYLAVLDQGIERGQQLQ